MILGQEKFYPNTSIQKIQQLRDACQPGIYFLDVPVPPQYADAPSYQWVSTGIELALQNKIHALVTAPISKEKWLRAGIQYKGHTQLLADTANTKNHCMFFWSNDLKVALFTVHIPLQEIFGHLQKEKITRFIRFVDTQLTRLFKKKFTFLVSGLNPHAGEDGIMGTQEKEIIIPAMEALKEEGDIRLQGPFPPDTIFLTAKNTPDSVVISWYHDQGLIAFKLLNIHNGVNMTLGLPYIRTSPDHGTAYDIAGKNIANPSSMKEALNLAELLI